MCIFMRNSLYLNLKGNPFINLKQTFKGNKLFIVLRNAENMAKILHYAKYIFTSLLYSPTVQVTGGGLGIGIVHKSIPNR